MKKLMLVTVLSVLPVFASAADWSSTNIQLLNGKGFKNSPTGEEEHGTVWTVEHASGWKYGSNYFFFDINEGNRNNESALYGEFSPTLSLPKILGTSTGGLIKDYGPTATFEIPMAPASRVNLYGFNVEWNVPGFAYLSTAFYSRDILTVPGTSTQVTVVWNVPFSISSAAFSFQGFADIASGEGSAEGYVLTQPQLLLDLDKTAGITGLSVGVEYSDWKNKYTVKDWNEKVLCGMIKWNL